MNTIKTLFMRLLRTARLVLGDRRAVAVFVPESVGSVGDQAMVEVMREQLTARNLKPTFVYMPNWTVIPLRADAPTVMLTSHTNFAPHFLRLILRHGAAVVIGADVVDGVYGNSLPQRWVGKLVRARETGAKVGLLNFSFSSEADHTISEVVSAAGPIKFTPRDPVSFGRFTAATKQPATLSADLAFLLTPDLRSPNAQKSDVWLAARKAAGDTVLFVNLSGHTLSRMARDGVEVMDQVLRHWLRASPDRSIFLVPHDFRPAPTGDVEALERLRAMLAGEFPDRVAMIYPPFAAWDVKALCRRADLAISGRMHLTIACLGMGVPALSVVYVGKFEGLMQHIGLADEDLLISTDDAIDPELLLVRLERVTAEHGRLSAIINAKLGDVKALSARNFDWL